MLLDETVRFTQGLAISLDRIQGMFIGAFLGDALGAPHEFKCNRNTVYSDILSNAAWMTGRGGKFELAVGQCTDDTEMTLTLLRTLIRDGGYNRTNVIKAYLEWANSRYPIPGQTKGKIAWMLGKNTRELFRGVNSVSGYEKRLQKQTVSSQSNGALMRCSPLALIWDYSVVKQDVGITNPNNISLEVENIYILALRLALLGQSSDYIYSDIKQHATIPEVIEVFRQIDDKASRDIVTKKGWVVNAFWVALTAMVYSSDSFTGAMRWIITQHPGSDTDTNACIGGALIGAILGYENMLKDPITATNVKILLGSDINSGPMPRPREYLPFDILTLSEMLYNLVK